MRTGRKVVGDSMVIYLNSETSSNPAHFGFVVSKAVGNAVERNKVKRRLRSAIQEKLAGFEKGQSLVIRALPSIKNLTWQELNDQIDGCLKQASKSLIR
jgi:ribonuclease P protein component